MDRGRLLGLSFLLVLFLDALPLDMFRHACTSQMIVNDELYSQPVHLFLMMEREAEAWPRTYRLITAAQESMSTDNLSYSHSASRRYQQSSSVSNDYHFCLSRGTTGITQNRGRCAGRTIQRQTSQGVRRVGGTQYSPRHNNTCSAFARRVFSGSVVTSEGRLEYQFFRQQPTFVLRMIPSTGLVDSFLFMVQMVY